MKKLKYSLIVPALNEEKYLPHLFESIKNQTEKFDEIIVVDNGSTDKTVVVAKKFGARVVKESKKGIANARNAGALAAKGDVVCFVDSDCYLGSKWLESAKKEIETTKNLAFTGFVYYNNGNLVQTLYFNVYTFIVYCLDYLNGIVLGHVFISGNNFAIYKNVYLELGGTPSAVVEDYYFSKNFWKKYSRKVSFVLGMMNRVSTRRFEKDGFLRTIWTWVYGWQFEKSQEDYGRDWDTAKVDIKAYED